MNNITDERIEGLIKNGKLIPYERIFKGYSKKRQQRIREGAERIMLAMKLRRLRKKTKLSQAKLAEKMAVKREYISRLESGKQNVTIDTLYRIAEATGTKFTFGFK